MNKLYFVDIAQLKIFEVTNFYQKGKKVKDMVQFDFDENVYIPRLDEQGGHTMGFPNREIFFQYEGAKKILDKLLAAKIKILVDRLVGNTFEKIVR